MSAVNAVNAVNAVKAVRLVRYRGFVDTLVPLSGTSVLVGANNAGKTTVVQALRLVAALVPHARSRNPKHVGVSNGETVRGWPVTTAAIEAAAFSAEAVRNDFRLHEARIDVEFTTGLHLVVTWPAIADLGAGEKPAFFHVAPPAGFIGDARKAVREMVPDIGVVPTLAPLDDEESEITDKALNRNLTGRRASRYFRNALYRSARESPSWRELKGFMLANTPEIDDLELVRRPAEEGHHEFDLFYQEPSSGHEREIVWAGDGLQIWLQVLFHLWRTRHTTTVVLDEPDVFLHPDLQRRLARLLFEDPRQMILATHSVEVLAEADPGTAVWVDRSRRRGERIKTDGMLATVGRRLGSGLELSLARALRSGLALFVEGHDLRLLSVLAAKADAPVFARADAFSVISLGGFSRNHVAGAFAEVVTALKAEVQTIVALDGDLRSEAVIEQVSAELRKKGARVYVWRRRELENYVLDPVALAGSSGLDLATASALLRTAVDSGENEARSELQSARFAERRGPVGLSAGFSDKTVIQLSAKEFDRLWSSEQGRVALVDAKQVIKELNRQLAAIGRQTVSTRSLARNLPRARMPRELLTFFHEVERLLHATGHQSSK